MPLDINAEGLKTITCRECKHKFKIELMITYTECPKCSAKMLFAYLGTIGGKFH